MKKRKNIKKNIDQNNKEKIAEYKRQYKQNNQLSLLKNISK